MVLKSALLLSNSTSPLVNIQDCEQPILFEDVLLKHLITKALLKCDCKYRILVRMEANELFAAN
jgi:hypothetical protein